MYQRFARHYDGLTQNVDYDGMAAFISGEIRRHQRSSGRLLVDLACGTGSLSLRLMEQGFDVIAVDRSGEMLAAAMDKAGESGSRPLFLCQEMAELDLYGTVDAVVSTLDSLSHLPDPAALLRVFRRVALFLEPGGVFLFDLNTPYKHEVILSNNVFVYELDEVFCVWQNTTDEHLVTRIDLDFFERMPDGRYRRESESFLERAFSEEEIREAITAAGLSVVAEYDDYRPEPLKADTQRCVMVCRKG